MWEEWTGASIRRNTKKIVETKLPQPAAKDPNGQIKKIKTQDIEKIYSQKISAKGPAL